MCKLTILCVYSFVNIIFLSEAFKYDHTDQFVLFYFISQHYCNLHISNIKYSIKHYKSQFNVYLNSPIKYTIAGKYMKIKF